LSLNHDIIRVFVRDFTNQENKKYIVALVTTVNIEIGDGIFWLPFE